MNCICFFNTAIAWGGGEKWHFEVSQHLHENGHHVLVIAHEKSVLLKRLKEAKIPSREIRVNNLSFLNPFKKAKLKKVFKKCNVDTLVLNLSRDVKFAAPTAKTAGVNRIIYRRGSAIPIKNSFFNRYLFKNALTEVLANSTATKRTVLENNANLFPKERIKVIHNGIEIPKNIDQFHSKIRRKDEGLTIVNLGRLEAQKNQGFLIELAQELKNRKITFKMIIGGEGRLREALEAKIMALGVEDVVHLFGFVDDPLDFLSQADVFVLPSHWEGFGYVLAEAALCKKPIVAFDISSNPELIIHGKTGYLVPKDDMDAFAEALIKLYENREMGMQMGELGFQHIKSTYEKEMKLQEIESYLLNG